MVLTNLELEVRKYGKEENFIVDTRKPKRIIVLVEGDLKLDLDEASFNELREKINEAYELRQM
ncbi:TPA: hypothetical protein I9094_001696 [Clostridium perfringens]|nr:hypothetical protein [Clostridium perfringens]HAT4346322.1 hypothetical protein [Clostridium perfringens]